MPTPPDPALQQQLTTLLLQKYSLPISPTYLTTHILSPTSASTRNTPTPPLPALLQTAHFRLLASDITLSLTTTNPNTLLPPTISAVTIKETHLQSAIPVQILDIQDLSVSKWTQIESLERIERGEEIRGREVIRTLPSTDTTNDNNSTEPNPANTNTTTPAGGAKRSLGPHKLTLQDASKRICTALELHPLPQIYIGEGGVSIGCKLILKPGTLVRRGMVMLAPATTTVLGGRVDSWDRKWREERKRVLGEGIGEGEEGRGAGGGNGG